MANVRLRFIVEGVHDEHVIGHLLHKHEIPDGFDFRPDKPEHRNKDYVLKNLRRLLDSDAEDIARVEKFALILDAESGVAIRWKEIKRAIGRELPSEPDPQGTIVGKDLGIWLMPDNVKEGSLEEFFEALIPPSDRLWLHANATVPLVPNDDFRFSPAQARKAMVQTWLAWRNPPALPMGFTIKRSEMNIEAELPSRFVAFVNRLLAQ